MHQEPEIGSAARDWLLIDCAHQGEVRLTQTAPGAKPIIGKEYRYETSVPTFTDVLLRYANDGGCPLQGLRPVVAIAGVPGERSMVIERSNWVISREGLTAVFGTAPIILNEVAAQAWALRSSLQGVQPFYGSDLPDLGKPGRYVFVTYEEGVGTAILDISHDGQCTVFDAEGGQLDFLPISEDERDLLRLLTRSPDAAISWEQLLMLRAGTVAGTSQAQQDRVWARLLGRFVSNLIYTCGAWSGAFITGRLIPSQLVMTAEFAPGLLTRRPYARFLSKATVCRVVQTNAVLRGCAAMMAYRFEREQMSQ